MNQSQRKFLLGAAEKRYHAERDALKKRRPTAPSLNNYLIAAVLDGSFILRDVELVRVALVKRVRDLGKSESLLADSSRTCSTSRS